LIFQTKTSKIRSKNAITLPYIQWLLKTATFVDRFYGQEKERGKKRERGTESEREKKQRKLENKKYYLEIIASKID
jgi:hypothetical protein